MSSSAFINALRRFIAMPGPVKQFRSDRGTNFVGATDDIGVDALNIEDNLLNNLLLDSNTVWKFNPPHSSHMGGVWERMIGISRIILESMLANVNTLTHDVLVTLMAEVTAIINSRPLLPVSCDPDVPDILTPVAILTHKVDTEKLDAGNFDVKDLYRQQWKRVNHLADLFWTRWRKEYLQSLQTRQKWKEDMDNIRKGDVVLIKDKVCARMDWPVGRVDEVFPTDDGKVRKVKVAIFKNEKLQYYIRPIVDLVLLVSSDCE